MFKIIDYDEYPGVFAVMKFKPVGIVYTGFYDDCKQYIGSIYTEQGKNDGNSNDNSSSSFTTHNMEQINGSKN